MKYDHLIIDKKWQKRWEEENCFYCDVHDFSKPKYYVLDMFPYPSGQGLHVGHPEGYTATDAVARMKRMQGYNVLHPMGYDSFGLPAEQYAIKTGNHPGGFTEQNIETFTRQLKMLGFSYDWSKEISTCDPSFYKWTQWIFKQFYLKGLAKQIDMPVNWCEELGTVLANDEVIDGKSERGGYPVTRINMKQWVMDIPKYAEKLLDGLNDLDWPSSTIEMQRNWIGKSIGAQITFKIKDSDLSFDVFTTRADTLYGCTYCVLAPENPLVEKITTKDRLEEVKKYQEFASRKSDLERTELNKEKTGTFTGAYAINPINGRVVPVFIGDYVLASYGTGAVMAVPAHDQRDYEFAKKHNLEMIQVLEGDISEHAMEDDAKHINSDIANGLNIEKAKEVIIKALEEKGLGKSKTNYKLREWVFARQRYWGEPIPVVHYEDHDEVLKDCELPLILPELEDYKPKISGTSPLANATSWVEVTNEKGEKGHRETNTMPGSAGSSWYFMRYIDPHNDEAFADYELLKHWLPVDLYIGGPEHAVGHLLYSRFWTNFLYDEGYSPVKEPFKKLFHQGMILGSNGEKMSKSRGNVVNPDDVVKEYGTDALRLYEMFMGPLEASLPWSSGGLEGARRWLDRVYRLFTEEEFTSKFSNENSKELDYVYNFTVKKVTSDYENLQFNTAISQMMIFINEVYKAKSIYLSYLEGFIKMLDCIAPHICEEIWALLGHNNVIVYESWPTYDESKLVKQEIEIGVQVNGKLRAAIVIPVDASEDEIKEIALSQEGIKRHTEGKEIKKIIVIKGKIVNIVAV